jgi:hypothetical protein
MNRNLAALDHSDDILVLDMDAPNKSPSKSLTGGKIHKRHKSRKHRSRKHKSRKHRK